MAGFRLTTKVQVSGWRFLLRRVENALVRRDTRMFDDPLGFYGRSAALGVVVSVLVLVAALAMAYFKPQGKMGTGNLYVEHSTNQLYLMVSGQLHPVYNLTSARLVLGKAEDPAGAKTADLNRLPKGQVMGIPGAPYATPVSSDSTSRWALCDTLSGVDTDHVAVQTAVISMPLRVNPVDPILPNEILLAAYQGKSWAITSTGRHATDLANRAMSEALGIPPDVKPSPISAALFNAIPDNGSWQLPPIPSAGAPNTLGLPDPMVIGSVLQVRRATTGRQYFVVLSDGIAPVNANTAAVLRATESYGLVEPPSVAPSVISKIETRTYTSLLPDDAIKITSRPQDPTVCWSWERGPGDHAPKTTILTAERLPIPLASMSNGIKQIQGSATVFIDGGKYVHIQSPDPRYGESLYYVDPQGVRYGLPDEQTAGSLGLTSPKAAPWEIVRLLVDGPVLSKDAALLEHDTLPADPSPRKAAADSPGEPQ
ncbi:MAG: type VII secretion protein EccB [Mycobacterium sp.]